MTGHNADYCRPSKATARKSPTRRSRWMASTSSPAPITPPHLGHRHRQEPAHPHRSQPRGQRRCLLARRQPRVTAGGDNQARIWDARTGQSTLTLSGHDGPVLLQASLPTGAESSPAAPTTPRLWDAYSGRCIFILNGHNEDVTSAVFFPMAAAHPDGRDKKAIIWDAATGRTTSTSTMPRTAFTPPATPPTVCAS